MERVMKCPKCDHSIHDDRAFCDAPVCGDGCCHCVCSYSRTLAELLDVLVKRGSGRKQAREAIVFQTACMVRELNDRKLVYERFVESDKKVRQLEIENRSLQRQIERSRTKLAAVNRVMMEELS